MYYYFCALIVYKVIQQLIYNLVLFLFYSSASIYLFSLLYSSHLVLIKCEILLVANIKTKLSLVLCLSSIITQTLYLLLTIGERPVFLLLHENFPTLYKPSTLSHLVMSPRVTLCLSNTQVLVHYLMTVQGFYYLSQLFTYTSTFTTLLYTSLNSHQSMPPLTSTLGLKAPLSLSALSLITRGLPLLGNDGITLTLTVCSK